MGGSWIFFSPGFFLFLSLGTGACSGGVIALSILGEVNCYWLIGVLALLTFFSGEELVVYTRGGISKPRKISLLVTWGLPFPCLTSSTHSTEYLPVT